VPLPSTPIHNLIMRYAVLKSKESCLWIPTTISASLLWIIELHEILRQAFLFPNPSLPFGIFVITSDTWMTITLWMIRNYISAQNSRILLADFPMHLSAIIWITWKPSHTIRTCPVSLKQCT
jgi:hypothetical protein